jgi:RHS repeat-associated protein
MDMHYYYTAGQNNGRVAQTVDGITGETVNYTYDSLNRLSTAQATNGSWGQIYSYDGWGNLNSKAPYGGQGPTYSATPDPRYNGGADPTVTDWLYATDVEDRPIGTQPITGYGQSFTYDQAGKMVFALSVSSLPLDESGNPAGNYPCEVRFYGINGQRLAAYSCFYSLGGGNTGFQYSLKEYDHKIAGILTEWGGKYLATDRLGSIRADYSGGQYSYYPYGEAKTAPTGQTGLYADLEDPVRGYDSYAGRWSKPDPLGMRAAVLGNPITWNRYAYANGDPVNFKDPPGLCAIWADDVGWKTDFCGGGGGSVGSGDMEEIGGVSGKGGDPEGGGPVYVTPKIQSPQLFSATQILAVTIGFNYALQHLNTIDCADFYSGTDHGATEFDPSDVVNALENTTYRLVTLPQGPGTGAQTVDATDVQLNLAGAFFNAGSNPNGTVMVKMPNSGGVLSTFTFADVGTFQGFLLLHEFGHQMGVYGIDLDSAANGANSASVLSHCFRQDAQGAYH